MFDARFTPIETPFVTVDKTMANPSGNGRYEVRTRNGKHYCCIVTDRKVTAAWVVKTNHNLQRGKPAWDFVVRQLREHNHVD
jgi:hypothetical protein